MHMLIQLKVFDHTEKNIKKQNCREKQNDIKE